jgi:hypothetical protein
VGGKVYLSEADTKAMATNTKKAIAKAESDSELRGPGKQETRVAQSEVAATAVG